MMMLDIPDPVLLAAKISTAVHPLLVIYNYMLNKQLYQKKDTNTTGSIKKTVSWLNETFFSKSGSQKSPWWVDHAWSLNEPDLPAAADTKDYAD